MKLFTFSTIKVLPALLTGLAWAQPYPSSSPSPTACGSDRLAYNIVENRKQLMGRLLETQSQLTYFQVQKNGDETWSDVASRLDQQVAWMRSLGGNNGCCTNSDCKVVTFANYTSLGGAGLDRDVHAYSAQYNMVHNSKDTLSLIRSNYKKYYELDQLIQQAAGVSTRPFFAPYTDFAAICYNYACVAGAMPSGGYAGQTYKELYFSDGLNTLSQRVPMDYRSEKIVIPTQ